MPQLFTSAPVLGALQVAAIEPNSVQTLRLTRSIHFHVADWLMTTSLPRGSIDVSGARRKIADRKTRHLRLGIGPAHGIGIDHRNAEMRRRQQRLHAVAAADLDRHHRLELAAEVLFHRRDGARNQPAVDQSVPG